MDHLVRILDAVDLVYRHKDTLQRGQLAPELGQFRLSIGLGANLHCLLQSWGDDALRTALDVLISDFTEAYIIEEDGTFTLESQCMRHPIKANKSMNYEDAEGCYNMHYDHMLNMYGLSEYGCARWDFLSRFRKFLVKRIRSLNSDSEG